MANKNKKGARHKQAHKEIKQRQRAEKAQNKCKTATARHLKAEKRRLTFIGWLRDKHKLVDENVGHAYLIDELRSELGEVKAEKKELAEQLKEVTDKLNRRNKQYAQLTAEVAALRVFVEDKDRNGTDLTCIDITDDGYAREEVSA